MKYYAGLDVSMEETSVCVVDESGSFVREGKVSTDPAAIGGFLSGVSVPLERRAGSRVPDAVAVA